MTIDDFINNLLKACDNIKQDWQEHLQFWEGEPAGYYNDVAIIVHYVIKQYKKGLTADFQTIFDIVELGVKSHDEHVSEVAVVGFVEGILFVGSHDNIRPEHFKKWIGSESYRRMISLEEYFSGANKR